MEKSLKESRRISWRDLGKNPRSSTSVSPREIPEIILGGLPERITKESLKELWKNFKMNYLKNNPWRNLEMNPWRHYGRNQWAHLEIREYRKKNWSNESLEESRSSTGINPCKNPGKKILRGYFGRNPTRHFDAVPIRSPLFAEIIEYFLVILVGSFECEQR